MAKLQPAADCIDNATTAFPKEMPAVVGAAFMALDDPVRSRLLDVRRLIFATAATTDGVGALTGTLKWGQPAYLTAETGSGTTVRLGASSITPGDCAVLVHCSTNLIERFRLLCPNVFRFEGNRAITFPASGPFPSEALAACLAQALTYHRRPR